MQYETIDRSKHHQQCFQNQSFSEYKPPRTVLSTDCIHPIQSNYNNHIINPHINKGFHFVKAKTPTLFPTVPSPGPASYNLPPSQPIENTRPRDISVKLKSNSREKSQSIGVGSYQIDHPQINKGYKQVRFTTAERVTYFQQAIFNSSNVPAPGQYNIAIRTKSHSLNDLPRSLPKQQKKLQKAKQAVALGPWSYEIKRSESVKCLATMRNPYRQKDQSMKRRLDEWRKSKQKTGSSADPGKYIKIEQWGKFNHSKQISDGLNSISRPYLRIYN